MTRLALTLALLLAAPLGGAESARTSEEHAILGALKDWLVKAYDKAGALNPHWTLADIDVRPEELQGSFYDASNFGMHVESVTPPVALIVCRSNFLYQRDNCLRVDLLARRGNFLEEAAPPGVGQSVWPEYKRINAGLQFEFEERRKREWLWLATVPLAYVPALIRFCLKGRKAARNRESAALFALGGFVVGGYVFLFNAWCSLVGWGERDFLLPWLPMCLTILGWVSVGLALLLLFLFRNTDNTIAQIEAAE